MMIIKRKVYSAVEEVPTEKKNSKGKKTAIILGSLGAGLGLAYGAKKGLLGTKASVLTNRELIRLGKAVNSQKMIDSGLKDTSKALYKRLNKISPADADYFIGNGSENLRLHYDYRGFNGLKDYTNDLLRMKRSIRL